MGKLLVMPADWKAVPVHRKEFTGESYQEMQCVEP